MSLGTLIKPRQWSDFVDMLTGTIYVNIVLVHVNRQAIMLQRAKNYVEANASN
jgi:hypothetical protein